MRPVIGRGLKIAVNTRLLLKNKLEGIGWFTYESLIRIVKSNPQHEFYFIFDRPYSDEFMFGDNVIPVVTGPPARHPILYYIWYEFSLPKVLNKLKPDIFISPDAMTSLRSPVPDLIVMHDLNFEHYPEIMPRVYRWYYKHFSPKFARKSSRIVTVSDFSRKDISQHYLVPEEKIDVVYNGAGLMYKPVSDVDTISVKKKYTDERDFFLFIGALNPRKNLTNIFKAFDIYKTNSKSFIKFVVVGEKMYWSDDIRNTYENMKHKSDVVFTGRLNQDELCKVLGSAKALVFASLFEGFGIPIVEAFNAEVPVITSNVSAMPEIAGDAALLVDPTDVYEISEAMASVESDKSLCESLVEKGRIRRSVFSWDNTASGLWESVLRTLK